MSHHEQEAEHKGTFAEGLEKAAHHPEKEASGDFSEGQEKMHPEGGMGHFSEGQEKMHSEDEKEGSYAEHKK